MLSFVVQVCVEVASWHGVKAGRDKMPLGERTRVIVLGTNEIVAGLLICAHYDINALAEVNVEALDLDWLHVVAT